MYAKIIREHIVSYFKINNLFTKKQFGFLKGRSTSIQLLNVLDQWTKDLDQGKPVDCICDIFRVYHITCKEQRVIH